MDCQVETYSGYRLHERPRRFSWGGEWLAVRQVQEQWSAPDALTFRVLAADDRVYLLTYHHLQDTWEAQRGGLAKK